MRLLIRTLVLSQDFFLRILLSFVIAGCTICHPRPPNLHLDLKHVRQQEWGVLEHFSWFFNIVNICSSSFIILTKLSVQREIPPEKHPIKNDLSKIWSSEKEIKDAVWGGHIPCPTISSRLCAIIITQLSHVCIRLRAKSSTWPHSPWSFFMYATKRNDFLTR
jgi:hypothetical protein